MSRLPDFKPRSIATWGGLAWLAATSLIAGGSDLQLLEAVQRGDREAMLSLVEQEVDANGSGANGETALHWAAYRNDLEATQLLISAGANPDAANVYGVTPLSLACTNRSDLIVHQLLEAGANPNAAQSTGETILMACSRTGNLAAVTSLLSRGADPNGKQARWEQTALMWALASGHSQVARKLVEHGAEVKARSKEGFTPLLFAVQQGDLESVRFLLSKGADPNYATPKHGNALTVASASGHEKVGLFLLGKGADPNSPDDHGVTALHYTMAQGLSLVNSLNYDDAYRMVPNNLSELAKALLDKGADPNAQIITRLRLGPDDPATGMGMEGATPFFLAALAGDAAMLRELVKHGADHRLRAKGNTTPLMAAAGAARGFTQGTIKKRLGAPEEAVRVVVELGADIHAARDDGQTALHAAAVTGEDAIVQYLVDLGAKVEAEDNLGQTPWSMAAGISPDLGRRGTYGNHQSTMDLLLRLGASRKSRKDMKTIE
ncbi:MAG: ankyrin repeat domain-containing protein [Acidobacteriota bacterium]|nr:ankyrin repeat domain-containing protein [Acidobacteriota bacterium]